MLQAFRRAVNSTLGKIIALGVLIVIALAFAAGDITNIRGNSGGTALGGAVAEVGDVKIGEGDFRQRVQSAYQAFQQQQPGLTIADFVTQGGMQSTLERVIAELSFVEFGEEIGVVASKRMVDGEIASIPAFRGLNGQFSQTLYDNVLRQQGLTDAVLRTDIARNLVARQLTAPTLGASQVPSQLALPYASLLLERRQGSVAYIPVGAFGGNATVSDAELQGFYTRNRARYTVPERRVIRYALVKAADVAATAKATPQEVAAAYNRGRAGFAPSETRTITQLVVADQAAANRIAQAVRGGTPLAAAARSAGLEAGTATNLTKAAYAGQNGQALADAAFAAGSGQVVGPIRSPLGWQVARVESVTAVPGKTLEQATPELTAAIEKQKAAAAVADLSARLDSAAAENATFDEIVGDAKLTAQTTKPLLATGVDPDAPAQPDPLTARLAQAAFAAVEGDAPQIVQTDADGSFAVVAVGRIVPAAPRPLAQIREVVGRDFVTDRNLRQARTVAADVMNKVNAGTPLATALGQANLTLPPVQPLNASRAELARQGAQLPPPVALMFSMAAKRAKILEAPNRGGWYVVYLDAIQSGNAAGNTNLVNSARAGLGGVIGQEYVEQFTRAVRDSVGVKRDDAALARAREALVGTGRP